MSLLNHVYGNYQAQKIIMLYKYVDHIEEGEKLVGILISLLLIPKEIINHISS
jgi:hypothetical protein